MTAAPTPAAPERPNYWLGLLLAFVLLGAGMAWQRRYLWGLLWLLIMLVAAFVLPLGPVVWRAGRFQLLAGQIIVSGLTLAWAVVCALSVATELVGVLVGRYLLVTVLVTALLGPGVGLPALALMHYRDTYQITYLEGRLPVPAARPALFWALTAAFLAYRGVLLYLQYRHR